MRLSESEARRRFASGRTAHLATADEHGRPHLVVVTFAAVGDQVVTAVDQKPKTTTSLRRLRQIEANPQVSMLVDHYDDADWSRLWWVRADGRATVLRDDADRAVPVDRLRGKYPQYAAEPPRGPVIRVAVDRWTGWAYTG